MTIGFITSAHYIQKKDYVRKIFYHLIIEISGYIDINKFGLSPNDGGGQVILKS